MLFLKIVGVLLVLLLLLLFLRVGAEVAFGAGETRVLLRVGLLRWQLLPRKGKKRQATKKDASAASKKKESQPATKPKLGWREWKSGAELLLPPLKRALRRTRRAVRIDPLRLHIVLGGDDPAAVGQSYGYAQALLWSAMPEAERLLNIPDPHIRLDADFDGGATRCQGEVGMRFRIGSMAAISLALLPPLLKWLRQLRTARSAAKPTEQPTTKTADAAPSAAAEKTTETIQPKTDEKGEHNGE